MKNLRNKPHRTECRLYSAKGLRTPEESEDYLKGMLTRRRHRVTLQKAGSGESLANCPPTKVIIILLLVTYYE
jgi:hypothetical protein